MAHVSVYLVLLIQALMVGTHGCSLPTGCHHKAQAGQGQEVIVGAQEGVKGC